MNPRGNQGGEPRVEHTDVVVVGSGMAGLVSAVRAQEAGADVLVLEKASRPGGTLPITGGAVFVIDESCEPDIDPFEPLETGVEWLTTIGAPVHDLPDEWTDGDGRHKHFDVQGMHKRVEPVDFVEFMVESIEKNGGELWLKTPLKELATDESGNLEGAIATSSDKDMIRIDAPSVILATGGIRGNEHLVERIVGHSNVWCRGIPTATGDGLIAAKAIGAKQTHGYAHAYAHQLLAPPAELNFEQIHNSTQFQVAKSVVIDNNGNRVADESGSADPSWGTINQAVLDNAQGRAWLLMDDKVYEAEWPHYHVGTRLERAKEIPGGTILTDDSLKELTDQLAEHGVNGENAMSTITTYNEAVRNNKGTELEPPRDRFQDPLDTPPFYAIKTQIGVSFFGGGLDVDANCRVLSRHRSTSLLLPFTSTMIEPAFEPITGLYATGIEIGRPNFPNSYHKAGLALGLATGRVAGNHAAHHALTTRSKP